jgi:hypothetical protein
MGGDAVRSQRFRMRFFYIMGNLRLYKIKCFHVIVTLESQRLKVAALSLFHLTASPPVSQKWVFSFCDTVSDGGGRVRVGGGHLTLFPPHLDPLLPGECVVKGLLEEGQSGSKVLERGSFRYGELSLAKNRMSSYS